MPLPIDRADRGPRAPTFEAARAASPAALALMFALAVLAGGRAARAEGPGVKLGDSLVLHPGISAGAGYDSNPFYAAPNESSTPLFYFTVRPSLSLATLSLQRGGNSPRFADFRFHVGAPMRFLFVNSPVINPINIGVDAGLVLALNPFGAWSFDLFDTFVRTSDMPWVRVLEAFRGKNLNIDNNIVGARLRWRPGGQRFESTLQYSFNAVYYENDVLAGKTMFLNSFTLRLKWNFFPKTALYVNVDETINSLPNTGPTTPPGAYPFRAVAGLLGLITAKLSVNLNVGYGNSFTQSNEFYPDNKAYSSVVGLVELTWKPAVFTALTLGYKHDFGAGLIGTYYDLDSAFLSLSQLLWRINGGLRFAWERRGYHGNLCNEGLRNVGTNAGATCSAENQAAAGAGQINRLDDVLTLHVQLDYPIKEWLFVSIGDNLTYNSSNCQFSDDKANIGGLPCNFVKNDVWLRLSLEY